MPDLFVRQRSIRTDKYLFLQIYFVWHGHCDALSVNGEKTLEIMKIDLATLFEMTQPDGFAGNAKPGKGGGENFAVILDGSMTSDRTAGNESNPAYKAVTEETAPPADGTFDSEQQVAVLTPPELAIIPETAPADEQNPEGFMFSIELGDFGGLLGLDSEQVAKLAALLDVPVEELGRVVINVDTLAGELKALTPAGVEKDLLQLLNLVENNNLLEKNDAVARIAKLLGLTGEQADKFFDQLKISSMEINAEPSVPKPPETAAKEPAVEISDAMKKQGERLAVGANIEKNKTKNDDKPETVLKEKVAASGEAIDSLEPEFQTAVERAAKAADSARPSQHANAVADKEAVAKNAVTGASFREPIETAGKPVADRVMNQIVEKAQVMSYPDRAHAKITLNPPTLGSVEIKITVHNSHAKAAIVVESAAVKHVVDHNIDQLKTALGQQGIDVDEINVSIQQQDSQDAGNGRYQFDARGSASVKNGIAETEETGTPGRDLAREMAMTAYNSVVNIRV